MILRAVLSAWISCLLLANVGSAEEPAKIATKFLPPGAELGELVRLDETTGEPVRKPAVLEGHLISSDAEDIIFAYHTKAPGLTSASLFVTIVHKSDSEYSKVAELTYYSRRLVTPDALRLIRLPGDDKESLAVVTGFGASLGSQLQVFQWKEPWGLVNVMPENGSVHRVSFKQDKDQITITLFFEKYPGEKGAPLPLSFHWKGDKFVKAPN